MTDSAAAAAFQAHAPDYDTARRRLVPVFDAFYGAAVDALSICAQPPRRVLDLGAGTGLLSARIAAAYPGAELVLLDAAPAMLERAAAAVGERATLHVADLGGPLPAGPFEAVVSALAIHHLDDDGKRDLMTRAHAVLAPGGVFVNAEQVAAPSPRLQTRYRDWHRAASAALGTTAEEWAAAEERMRHDRCSTLEDQLRWLRDAGFAETDCLYKHHGFAVMFALRGA